MKSFRLPNFLAVFILAIGMLAAGPTGCNATLDPQGVYQGDKFLYSAEKTITTAYKSFDSFVKWEHDYRAVLPIEVSKAADTIRLNAQRWIASASAFRDVYVANPTKENRDKLSLALNLIDTALSEATRYMLDNKAKAPQK